MYFCRSNFWNDWHPTKKTPDFSLSFSHFSNCNAKLLVAQDKNFDVVWESSISRHPTYQKMPSPLFYQYSQNQQLLSSLLAVPKSQYLHGTASCPEALIPCLLSCCLRSTTAEAAAGLRKCHCAAFDPPGTPHLTQEGAKSLRWSLSPLTLHDCLPPRLWPHRPSH